MKNKKFGKLKLFDYKPTIIAEAGVNHNCDIKLAKEYINLASRAGANAIKLINQFVNQFQLTGIQKKKKLKVSTNYLKNMKNSIFLITLIYTNTAKKKIYYL